MCLVLVIITLKHLFCAKYLINIMDDIEQVFFNLQNEIIVYGSF